MGEKAEDTAATTSENKAPQATKKKKTKRSTNSKNLSASARSTGSSRRGDDGGEGRRRARSRSTDRGVKPRRDSGGNLKRDDNDATSWERKGRSAAKDGHLRGSGGGGSARHHSPQRVRKGGNKSESSGPNSKAKDRSRSKSPSRSTAAAPPGHAPRLPQRTVSDSSDLQSALEATKNKHKGPIQKKDSFEEASMGDFKLYAQKQEQKRWQGSSLGLPSSSRLQQQQKMGGIVEESLGSFTAFHAKYEEEKLLGLHDADEGPDVYGQNSVKPPPPTQAQHEPSNDASMSLANILGPPKARNNDVSMSLGNIMSPMNQYGDMAKGQSKRPPVEESLGSFTAFHRNYEQEKLLGLHESTLGYLEPQQSTQPPPKEKSPVIPEESMGDFVQLAAKEENNAKEDPPNSKTTPDKKQQDSSELKDNKEYPQIALPKSRVEKLGKRGGVGYKIMVDTPGGHAPEPMKIVVAIEFDEDDTDSEYSEEEEEVELLPPKPESEEVVASSSPKASAETDEASNDQADEMIETGHLPLSTLDDDHIKEKSHDKPQKKKRHSKHQKQQTEEEDEDFCSESHDEVGPLGINSCRWDQSGDLTGSPKQPERENSLHSVANSISSHSTVSALTMGSGLEGLPTHNNERTASNPNSAGRRPGGTQRGQGLNTKLRRPSGAIPVKGTATLLRRPSAVPHNLGTRRGLMLRQQSEASMMSNATSKSNDSSWTGPNNDVPQDYQASFMQLNLTNLEKTEMQTNEEVEQAELPDALRSGVEGLEEVLNEAQQHEEAAEADFDAIPEGKDPVLAASELLGMKTMLKHIRKAAPKRSKSFEMGDMPKKMWNNMFASKSQLPGAQYVDNDDSTGRDEDDKIESTRTAPPILQGSRSQEETPDSKGVASGLFGTIMKVTGTGPSSSKPAENSGSNSKGKASLWNSTIGSVIPSSVIPSTKKSKSDEHNQDHTEKSLEDAEPSEGSLELNGILAEMDKSLALNLDASGYGDEEEKANSRRDSAEKGKEGSGRGVRARREVGRKGTARNRSSKARDVHNRSLRDTIDFYTAEQEDDELPQLETMNEDEAKKKPRVRARQRRPNRTKSDEGMGNVGRGKMDSSSRKVHRTRSQEVSPVRPNRDDQRKLHMSFSGGDPSDAPPSLRRQGTKSREGGKDAPPRTKSSDRGVRSSTGRKPRPQRKKSNAGVDEQHEAVIKRRGADLHGKGEKEKREILGYQ